MVGKMLKRGRHTPAVIQLHTDTQRLTQTCIAADGNPVIGNSIAGFAIIDGGTEAPFHKKGLVQIDRPGQPGIGKTGRPAKIGMRPKVKARHKGIGHPVLQRQQPGADNLSGKIDDAALTAAISLC